MSNEEIISEILNLNNQDETIRNEATESLISRISSPPFLETLLEFIVDQNIQSQQKLFIQTLVVLKECIKYNYHKCETSDENFTKTLPIALIQILDSIPTEHHSHIIDCFRRINDISYKLSPYNTQDNFLNSIQISTIPFILEQIKEQKNFVSNLYILKLFIKFYIREDIGSRNTEFFAQVFNEIIRIFNEMLDKQEINETTASALRILSQIINNSINSDIIKIIQYINPEDVIAIITNYSNFYNFDFEKKNSLNRHLLKLSLNLTLFYFIYPNFKTAIFPILFNVTMTLLTEMKSNSWDIFIRFYSLKILQYLYNSHEFVDEINSPDFLTCVLIPSAKLTEEDLADLSTKPDLIPYYFLMKKDNFIDQSNENTNQDIVMNYSVREICGSFANTLLKIPELFSIVSEPTEDPIEFESHIFLLSCVNSTSNLAPPELIHSILDLAISNFESNPPFLQASSIYYLYHHISLISEDSSTLIQLCVFSINNSNDPLTIIAASDLLLEKRLYFQDFENDEEKNSIIPKLLEFCDSFNYWEPLDVIVKLVKNQSDETKDDVGPFLNELLSALFDNCLSIVTRTAASSDEDNDSEEGLKKILDNIISIIKDDFITDEVVSFCIQKCILILKEIQYIYLIPLFNFVSFFNYLLRDPIEDQFEFIMIALTTNSEFAPLLLGAIYPLILNPKSNIKEREEFVQAIAEICQFCTDKYVLEKESLIRVCSALIEVFGEKFMQFTELAFLAFSSDYSSDEQSGILEKYYTHLVYLLYNAFNANQSFVISNLNEKILYYLCNFSISEISYGQFIPNNNKGTYFKGEVKCHFLLLLELAKKGKEEGAPELLSNYCEQCFRQALIVAKSLASAKDYTKNPEYCFYKQFSYTIALRYFPTSVDQIDEWDFLKKVLEEDGFELTPLELKRINEVINDNQESFP